MLLHISKEWNESIFMIIFLFYEQTNSQIILVCILIVLSFYK